MFAYAMLRHTAAAIISCARYGGDDADTLLRASAAGEMVDATMLDSADIQRQPDIMMPP